MPTACYFFFFFNDTATTEIYTLSLHDALPISRVRQAVALAARATGEQHGAHAGRLADADGAHVGLDELHGVVDRSEEHTSELQSRLHLVCRLLLEKKKPVNHGLFLELFDLLST